MLAESASATTFRKLRNIQLSRGDSIRLTGVKFAHFINLSKLVVIKASVIILYSILIAILQELV